MPKTTPRERTRRWWVAGGIAAVCVIAAAGWFVVRWWSAEPWEELERVAETFPTPSGFELSEQLWIGDRPAVCQVKPSCGDPRIRVEYLPAQGTPGGDAICAALEASTGAWESMGFSIRQTRTGNAETPCIVDGGIGGHDVQALGLSAEGGGPGLAVVIWN